MKMKLRLSIAMLCGVIISSCSAREKVIGLRQNIHHDDFQYSVQSVERVAQIGNLSARGTFYIVGFQVENRARRVSHRWDNTIAYLIDETGTLHDNDPAAQKELNGIQPFTYKGEFDTPAEATEATMLVFDLPKEVKQPYLQVRGLLLMGDVFDGSQYKKTKVKLF